MKFRTTFILLGILVILLASVILLEHRSTRVQEKKEQSEKLTDFKVSDIEKISLRIDNQTSFTLSKDEKGNWQIIEPIEAEADDYEARSLVENFASLRMEKVVEKQPADLTAYEIPKKEVLLWIKDMSQPVVIQVGMENPIDNTLYARRTDRPELVLIPGYLRYSLDKKLFDLRKKDILKFATDQVEEIELKSSEVNWKIKRQKDSWYLVQPVAALASKYQIDNLLDNLSRLRAREFLAEEKTPENLKQFGLDKPEFTINLSLRESQQLSFFINRQDSKVIATNSLSRKIIEVESQIINDLTRRVPDLREKKVAQFNSWEVVAVSLKKKDQTEILAQKELVKEKKQETEKWFLLSGGGAKEPADESKIESLLRKLEYLEAQDFIDHPESLSSYGLDHPRLVITIKHKPVDKEEQIIELLVGSEDQKQLQVVIKNRDFDYLFRVDSAFLQQLPEKAEDWKQVENKNQI